MSTKYTNPDPKVIASGLTITFEPAIVIKTIGGINITTKKVVVTEMIDNPSDKTVTVITNNNTSYLLWKGPAYDTIGQWTNTDVTNRLRELIISKSTGI